MAKKESRAELRQSYVHNRMVIIAPKRGVRPHNIADTVEDAADVARKPGKPDPFSVENQKGVKGLYTIKQKGGWRVKVVENIFPAVSRDNPEVYGTQEVVIETPDPNTDLAELPEEHIADILKAYQARTKSLARDKRIQYVLIYKNDGGRAGATVEHAHSQIFASGFVPPHVIEKLRRAEEYKIHHGTSYYMDLLRRERGGPRWVMEKDGVAALTPYASYYNYEVWILPTRPVDNITQLTDKERRTMAHVLKHLTMKIGELGLPYNFYLHQVVPYDEEHLYVRLAPRKAIWAGVELGTRLIINSVPPEVAAKFYRPKEEKKKKKLRARKRR
jgi:UDPglucose--hexose-1-phosphate uridylyltransferase